MIFLVFNFSIPLISASFSQLAKRFDILFIFILLKFDRSTVFKLLQFSNKPEISSILFKSKFKLIDSKDIHPLNILDIFLTFFVFNWLKNVKSLIFVDENI